LECGDFFFQQFNFVRRGLPGAGFRAGKSAQLIGYGIDLYDFL
jgi:hypothetical protein